ncbi:MAG TPA: substrate-binding domain-containing protein [Vicinamibacteria bacterium]|nr:substrate-binding domain-containing protein [Vicinamibacteria bacterium]HRB11523.1 substrate-binding domain-containing protein [Vicinamibacteria bacterium]
MGLRRLRFAAWVLLAWCAFLPSLASAQGVDRSLRVVVNKENKLASLTTDDLTRIFLGKKTLWDSGTRIVPVMPEEESPTGELFLSGTLKKSVSQFRAYWKRLLFSGGGAVPKVFRNHDQLLDFVARQPGAIGIVEASAVDDRVRVLEISN